jgi:hypothetical protein
MHFPRVRAPRLARRYLLSRLAAVSALGRDRRGVRFPRVGAVRAARARLRGLVRKESAFLPQLDGDSRTLLIAMSSLQQGRFQPHFEFVKIARALPCKKLFVRDLHQAWYLKGLTGRGDLASVADEIRRVIAGEEVERLVLVGSSAGGYAALVVGTLLGADAVLAFSPQTVLDLDVLAGMDHRWDKPLNALAGSGKLDPHWSDLRVALPPIRCADTRYQIYFAEKHVPDRRHAERLLGVDGTTLFRFGLRTHQIAMAMRESGALSQVLRSALFPAPPAAKSTRPESTPIGVRVDRGEKPGRP